MTQEQFEKATDLNWQFNAIQDDMRFILQRLEDVTNRPELLPIIESAKEEVKSYFNGHLVALKAEFDAL